MRAPSAAERRKMAFLANDYSLEGVHNNWFRRTPYVRYDPQTGQILSYGTSSIAALEKRTAEDGVPWLPGIGEIDTHYVDIGQGRLRLRSACPAAQIGDRIVNVPVPSRITIEEPSSGRQSYDWNNPELEPEFDHPGEYTITIESVRHRPGIFKVTVDG